MGAHRGSAAHVEGMGKGSPPKAFADTAHGPAPAARIYRPGGGRTILFPL